MELEYTKPKEIKETVDITNNCIYVTVNRLANYMTVEYRDNKQGYYGYANAEEVVTKFREWYCKEISDSEGVNEVAFCLVLDVSR